MTTVSRLWTLAFPAPVAWLNANDRGHWGARARRVAEWRNTTHIYAVKTKLPKGLPRVRIDATLRFVDARRRDAANYHATLKPIVDALTVSRRPGVAGYGLIPDDTPEYLDGPHITIGEPVGRHPRMPYGEVVLYIAELVAEATS